MGENGVEPYTVPETPKFSSKDIRKAIEVRQVQPIFASDRRRRCELLIRKLETQKCPTNVFSDVQTTTTFNIASSISNVLGVHGNSNEAVNRRVNGNQFVRSGEKRGVNGDARESLFTEDREFGDQVRGAGDKTNIEIEKRDGLPLFSGINSMEGREGEFRKEKKSSSSASDPVQIQGISSVR